MNDLICSTKAKPKVELYVGVLIYQSGATGFIRASNNLFMVANQEDMKSILKMKQVVNGLDNQLLNVQ